MSKLTHEHIQYSFCLPTQTVNLPFHFIHVKVSPCAKHLKTQQYPMHNWDIKWVFLQMNTQACEKLMLVVSTYRPPGVRGLLAVVYFLIDLKLSVIL